MRKLLLASLALALVTGSARSGEKTKQAPKIILQSPDGKKSYDLAKLVEKGPVLVRLTCACSGCDKELPYFQKLQAAYNAKGLQTVAVFREAPEAADSYAVKKGIRFMWLSDPKGELWKTFDAKAMPTNILIAKGGRVVRILPGCTRDGRNAQQLSRDIASLVNAPVAAIADTKGKSK